MYRHTYAKILYVVRMQCLAVLSAVFGSVRAASYAHTKCIYIYIAICIFLPGMYILDKYKHNFFHQGTAAHQEAKGQHHLVGLVAMTAGTP